MFIVQSSKFIVSSFRFIVHRSKFIVRSGSFVVRSGSFIFEAFRRAMNIILQSYAHFFFTAKFFFIFFRAHAIFRSVFFAGECFSLEIKEKRRRNVRDRWRRQARPVMTGRASPLRSVLMELRQGACDVMTGAVK
jgi:hypothetical protein